MGAAAWFRYRGKSIEEQREGGRQLIYLIAILTGD